MLARKGSLRRAARALARSAPFWPVTACDGRLRRDQSGSCLPSYVNYVLITSVNHLLELDTEGLPHPEAYGMDY